MSDLIGSYYAASLFCFWIVVAVALFDQITMNDGMIILGRFRRLSLVRVHWEAIIPRSIQEPVSTVLVPGLSPIRK